VTGLDISTLSLGAAFLAGLAGSGHCLAMCGGIAGALALRDHGPDAGTGARVRLALVYNLARISSYALAGALAGFVGDTLLDVVDVAALSIALRVLAGAVIVAAAGRLLFGWRLLDPVEAAGSRLWRRLMPWASGSARSRGGVGGAVGLGLAWGWLPCGLSYSMLLLAATTADAATGAMVMAAFGLGTLPAMATATVAFERAARVMSRKATLRNAAGTLLLVFGAWTAGLAVYHGVAHGGHASGGDPSHQGHAAHQEHQGHPEPPAAPTPHHHH
jgi:sulfite exporter TauE/SafE